MNNQKLALTLAVSALLAACGGGGSDDSGSAPVNSSKSSAASSSSSTSSVDASSSSSASSDANACSVFNDVQGFAALNDLDQPFLVTGGADKGEGHYEISVSNGIELRDAVYSSASAYKDKPLTIFVTDLITWENSGNADIRIERSDVSIIGRGVEAGFEGVGIELKPKNASAPVQNIIIRNLKMRLVPQAHGTGDIISLDGRNGPIRNIWIDHNELYNALETPGCTSESCHKDFYDELISGRADVRNVTISYNYLHDSWKTSLWGSSDTADQGDADRRITFHHNYWHNLNSRLPLFRFGEAHIFNNYYHEVAGSGINVRMGAVMRIDGNVFENVKNPIVSIDSDELGYWTVEDNQFVNITTSNGNCNSSTPPCYRAHEQSTVTDHQPVYDYQLTPVTEVKNHVVENAGVNKIEACLGFPEDA